MKYEIIGWTDDEDESYEEASNSTFAVDNVIIDEIKRKHYLFTGYHHQYSLNCVPILNNGKKYTFSQRGFGYLMAEAHNHHDYYDYSLYAYNWGDDENYHFPDSIIYDEKIKTLEELKETFIFEVNKEDYEIIKNKHFYKFPYDKKYRYIEEGDRAIITCEEEENLTFSIKEVFAKKDLSKREMELLDDIGESETVQKMWREAPVIIEVIFD